MIIVYVQVFPISAAMGVYRAFNTSPSLVEHLVRICLFLWDGIVCEYVKTCEETKEFEAVVRRVSNYSKAVVRSQTKTIVRFWALLS